MTQNNWVTLAPKTHGGCSNKKEVRLREGGFYLTAQASRDLDIKDNNYVILKIDDQFINCPEKSPKLLIKKAENNLEYGACRVRKDKNSDGISFPCKWVYSLIPKLEELRKGKLHSKRLPLKSDDGINYFINIIPSFENKTTVDDLPNINGIYRLKDVNSNPSIVYIGHGNIKNRIKNDHIDNKIFQIVEYSIIEEEEDRKFFEKYYLDDFKKDNGKYPKFNKQGSHFKRDEDFEKIISINENKKEYLNG